jgi:hypothetical protein
MPFAVDDRELPVLPAKTVHIVPVDPENEKTGLRWPPPIIPDPFAGIRDEAQVSDGALELTLPLRVLLRSQPHGAGVERSHVRPCRDVVRG